MTAFNFSISDQGGNVDYLPYRDGAASGGWNLTYSGQASVPYTQGVLGPGSSSHVTTFVGASASLNFTGHTAYVYGAAKDDSWYNITCDGAATGITSGYAGGVLGCCSNMTIGQSHVISIKATTTNTLAITGFQVQTTLGSDGAKILNNSIQAAPAGTRKRAEAETSKWYSPAAGALASLLFPGDQRASRLAKRGNYGDGTWQSLGNWAVNSDAGGGGGSNNTWYPRITTNAATSVLIMNIPHNTSFIWIEGSVDWNHGAYEVQAIPDGNEALRTVWDRANGSSRWTSTGQAMCFRQMDPTKAWQLSVTNVGPDPLSVWDINSLHYVQTSDALVNTTNSGSGNSNINSSKSSSMSAGAIAGIVVGVVAVAAFAILAFFFVRQRKQVRQQPYLEPGVADLDDGEHDKFGRVMPFEGDMSQRGGEGATQSLYASVPILSPGLHSSGESQQNSRNSKSGVPTSPTTETTTYPQDTTEPTFSQVTSPPSSAGIDDERVLAAPLASPSAESTTSDPPFSAGSQSSKTPRASRILPAAAPVFRQERDAGRVAAAPVEDVIPPEYNPEWAPSSNNH